MNPAASLGDGARLLSQHVDGLEVSCAVDQVRLLLRGQPDELEARLSLLETRARRESPALGTATGWDWGNDPGEPVMLNSYPKRRGRPYSIECSAWIIFIAPLRSVVPRLSIQFRSEYLLSVGPPRAYDRTRGWVERHLLPEMGGVAPDSSPAWCISRLDLAADITGVQLDAATMDLLTARATARRTYFDGDDFGGSE